MSSSQTGQWLALLASLSACQQLEHIRTDVCGNHVIEADEECDSTNSSLCYPPYDADQARSCRLVCNDAQPCRRGGCGADGVCRLPATAFEPFPLDNTANVESFVVADLTGDRRDDLLLTPFGGRRSALMFDVNRDPSVRDTSLGLATIITGELSCDAREDVVEFIPPRGYPDQGVGGALQVWQADEYSVLLPASQLLAPPRGSSRRLLSADSDGDARVEPLLLVDKELYRIPVDGSSQFQPLLSVDVNSRQLAGKVPSGNWDPSTPCDEIALAARDASAVDVYTLCGDATNKKIATVALPVGKTIGASGVFSGDVDGDGRADLLVTTKPASASEEQGSNCFAQSDCEGSELYVSYGAGDGSFHDSPDSPAGSRGSGRTATAPIRLPSMLLAMAELDGDGRADFVLRDGTLLSRRFTGNCPAQEFSCIVYRDDPPWGLAVASDFNRDGFIDLIGTPVGTRELTFSLGIGSGDFNNFHVSTHGSVAPVLSSEDSATGSLQANESDPVLTVGDFNGDLTNDIAFVERTERGPECFTLSVLFGVPLGTPAQVQQVASMAEIHDLAAGALFQRPGGLSDLVMLAKDGGAEGLGLFTGQTDRQLFSPLAVPIDPLRKQPVELLDVALGRFRSSDGGEPSCVGSSERRRRQDMALLGRNQDGELLLFLLVANGEHGFESTTIEAPLRLPGPASGSLADAGFRLAAIDLDAAEGDGVEEILLYPSALGPGPFRYWVARRAEGFSVAEFTTDVRGLPARAFEVFPQRRLRDVDGNGKIDLLLSARSRRDPASFEDAPDARHEVVLPNLGDGRLAAGVAFSVPADYDSTYLNIDADPELELAVAVVDGQRVGGVQLFDLAVPLEPAPLIPRLTLAQDETWWALAAGDFDGDGVEDLAAIPDAVDGRVQIFWAETQRP